MNMISVILQTVYQPVVGGFYNDAEKVLLKRFQCGEYDIQVIGQSFFKAPLIFIVDDTDIIIGWGGVPFI